MSTCILRRQRSPVGWPPSSYFHSPSSAFTTLNIRIRWVLLLGSISHVKVSFSLRADFKNYFTKEVHNFFSLGSNSGLPITLPTERWEPWIHWVLPLSSLPPVSVRWLMSQSENSDSPQCLAFFFMYTEQVPPPWFILQYSAVYIITSRNQPKLSSYHGIPSYLSKFLWYVSFSHSYSHYNRIFRGKGGKHMFFIYSHMPIDCSLWIVYFCHFLLW